MAIQTTTDNERTAPDISLASEVATVTLASNDDVLDWPVFDAAAAFAEETIHRLTAREVEQ